MTDTDTRFEGYPASLPLYGLKTKRPCELNDQSQGRFL